MANALLSLTAQIAKTELGGNPLSNLGAAKKESGGANFTNVLKEQLLDAPREAGKSAEQSVMKNEGLVDITTKMSNFGTSLDTATTLIKTAIKAHEDVSRMM